MARDATNLIGAVVRTVEGGERDGRPTRMVIATASYDTTADDLWDALTNPNRIPRWFLPVSGDFRIGGTYQLEGNAGGTINECQAPRRLAVTWEFGDQVSWLKLDLSPESAERANLRLEHTAEVGDGVFWDQFGPGAVGVGWDLSLMGLRLYLDGGVPLDPNAFEAWSVSDEGKAFAGASSDAWFEASVAFGTDRAAAESARDATTVFYTGGEA